MTPSHVVSSRIAQRTIQRFVDKAGLVYFGTVDQHDDEHRLVRGHTVSATHIDNHYSVGSIRGYDVTMVLRNDVIQKIGSHHADQRCHWLIVTIDLKTKHDAPHFYVGHRSRDEAFRASFEQLSPIALGAFAPYPQHFLDAYTVYGHATHALAIEQIITPQIALVIMSHFKEASFEIEDNTIYLYVESAYPSEDILERMMSNGLWLAESIDAIYQAVDDERF